MNETWYQKTWRPACAAVYLLICLMDFIIMPHLIYRKDYTVNNKQIIELAQTFQDSSVQKEVISSLANKREWEPLTLMGGGMFHISFGAILGVAAYSRGIDKTNFNFNNQDDYDDPRRKRRNNNKPSQDEYDIK